MNIVQLKSFIMAYETRNLVRCAASLSVSQSAISQQIKRLEEELDTELFLHRKGAITPTQSGDVFYPYAKRAIEALEQGRQALHTTLENAAIEIYCFFYNGRSSLSEFISDFSKLHPEVEIKLRTIKARKSGAIQETPVQNALYFSEAAWKMGDGAQFYRLYESQCLCIMREDNPLAKREALDAKDLVDQTVYLPGGNYNTILTAMEELLENLPEKNRRKGRGYLEALFNISVAGGVLVCPEYLFAPVEKLVGIPYKPDYKFDVGFSYVGNLSPSMKLFLDYLKERYEEKEE